MTKEEQKIMAQKVFTPGDPELVKLKCKAHDLSVSFNQLYENDTEKRMRIYEELFAAFGDGSFMQGPIFIHYGCHTRIGAGNFFNFRTTIQDDALVTIGDRNNFGPGLTIVTPVHPMLAAERRVHKLPNGSKKGFCRAQPVTIGDDCWFGANVTVCPGVTIGSGCVIGAGAVVTKDVPDNCFAAGVPARVIRQITEADSWKGADFLGEYAEYF